MLKQLYVKDFTLIDELNIDFHPGFSVITGETGAGKSIILGASISCSDKGPTASRSRTAARSAW